MRFYVLCYSDYEGITPHVIAEVVRDGIDDDRATTLATALAGDRARIVTRTELLVDPVGRQALKAWESGNDNEYDRESLAILQSATKRLRAVVESATRRGRSRNLPGDATLLSRARGLRKIVPTLVAGSGARRSSRSRRVQKGEEAVDDGS